MKKGLILIFLVSLVVLISACTIKLPKVNVPQQGCCAVISGGNVIGCANTFTDSDCNTLYSQFGDGTEFTPGGCIENSENIQKCSGITSCMGFNSTDVPYLIPENNFGCDSNKLYNCINGQINLVNDCDNNINGGTCDNILQDCSGGVSGKNYCNEKPYGTMCYIYDESYDNIYPGFCISNTCQLCIPLNDWNNEELCRSDFNIYTSPCADDPYLPECDSYEHLNFCKQLLGSDVCRYNTWPEGSPSCQQPRPSTSLCIHGPDLNNDNYYFGACYNLGEGMECISGV